MVWNMNMIPYNAKKCQNIVKIFKNFLSKIGGLSVHVCAFGCRHAYTTAAQHSTSACSVHISIKTAESTQSYSIPGRLLKETAKEIKPALTFIFQASINQSKI